jgi:hypothetical protein
MSSDNFEGCRREEDGVREGLTTMVFGLAPIECDGGGVALSATSTLALGSSDSEGMRSSGKGDSILGIFNGLSAALEELFLESPWLVLIAAAFVGGVDVRGRDADGFCRGDDFGRGRDSGLRATELCPLDGDLTSPRSPFTRFSG